MDDPAQLRSRLAKYEWLTPGEVAALTGASRSTVDRWLTADPPLVRWRRKPFSRHRVCDPRDVRKIVTDMDRQSEM